MSSARGESYVRGGFGPEPVSLGRVSGCGPSEWFKEVSVSPGGPVRKVCPSPGAVLFGYGGWDRLIG